MPPVFGAEHNSQLFPRVRVLVATVVVFCVDSSRSLSNAKLVADILAHTISSLVSVGNRACRRTNDATT